MGCCEPLLLNRRQLHSSAGCREVHSPATELSCDQPSPFRSLAAQGLPHQLCRHALSSARASTRQVRRSQARYSQGPITTTAAVHRAGPRETRRTDCAHVAPREAQTSSSSFSLCFSASSICPVCLAVKPSSSFSAR